MGLFECILQLRLAIFNHFDVQVESHDLAGMRALIECSFGIEIFHFYLVLKMNYIILKMKK